MKNQEIKINQESQKNSLVAFTAVKSQEVTKAIKGKSLPAIRSSKSFTLATARKEAGIETAENLISQFVIDTANALNMMSAVSEASIQAIAEDVYSIAFFLNIEEIAYFFKQLRSGKYGELYNNLNSIKVCTAMNRYILDRSLHFERESIQSHHSNKESAAKRTNEGSEFRKISRQAVQRYNSEKK